MGVLLFLLDIILSAFDCEVVDIIAEKNSEAAEAFARLSCKKLPGRFRERPAFGRWETTSLDPKHTLEIAGTYTIHLHEPVDKMAVGVSTNVL